MNTLYYITSLLSIIFINYIRIAKTKVIALLFKSHRIHVSVHQEPSSGQLLLLNQVHISVCTYVEPGIYWRMYLVE
jgi:hypothetical protein